MFHKEARVHNLQHKKEQIEIGANTHIRGELLVYAHGGKIEIGEYCYIGEFSRIWSAAHIKIGNGVLIAHNVNIHDNNAHPIDANERFNHTKHIIEKGHPTQISLDEKPVTIEDEAWVGFNATVLKGVHIGRGAIVGACAVVTKDVPEYAIVVGNPAKIIGYANERK